MGAGQSKTDQDEQAILNESPVQVPQDVVSHLADTATAPGPSLERQFSIDTEIWTFIHAERRFSQPTLAHDITMHSFLKKQIASSRPDRYWIEAFPFCADGTRAPDLIGYGLGTASKIELFVNPYNNKDSTMASTNDYAWERRRIGELKFPVAFSYADISGNGFNDVILSDQCDPSMQDTFPEVGRISWIENTGVNGYDNWTQRFIGKSPGMHCLKVGHFTVRDHIQIIAVPIVVKSGDLTTPTPVIIYSAPTNPTQTDELWKCDIAFNEFHLIHEVTVIPGTNGGLDHVLLAGGEGLTLIWYDFCTEKWMSENIGMGLPETRGIPSWDSGSVAVAKVYEDSAGYIASSEGNHVSVYVKRKNAPANELAGTYWTRHVLDDFGPSNEQNTGSIRHIVCADIDGDGVEEVLVALVGSGPFSWTKSGVWCYKLIDLENGKFAKSKLSDDATGRIAVSDFRNRGMLDFITISYSASDDSASPNPSINAFFNSPISVEKLNAEVLFRIPRPSTAHLCDEVEFLDVSSRKLSLVVVPKYSKYRVEDKAGVKVISGRVIWKDKAGLYQERTAATQPFTQVSILVDSDDGYLRTDVEGAAFILFRKSLTSGQPPYSDMNQLVAHNAFPAHFPNAIRHMEFPWVKVQDRPWAHGGFKDLEFYNLVGFHVRYADDSDAEVCHIQFWTAGVGVSAGFHNHIDKSFCEIHACMVNGTGKGGMSWATVSDEEFNPAEPDKSNYKSLIVPDMSEHGPLWRTGMDGVPLLRKNDTVDYPWHAWIAGGQQTDKQSFDVWAAFEFPSFAHSTTEPEGEILKPGLYHIINSVTKLAIAVEDGSSADGAAIILKPLTDGDSNKDILWEVVILPGTNFYSLRNLTSGSVATVAWPPSLNQRITGSSSPASMHLTSAWDLNLVRTDVFSIRLMGTDFILSVSDDSARAVLGAPSSENNHNWSFVSVKNVVE